MAVETRRISLRDWSIEAVAAAIAPTGSICKYDYVSHNSRQMVFGLEVTIVEVIIK